MNQLFHLGLCNALLAGGLCLLAFVLDRRFRQPRVTHTVLLFALLKLVTPPLFRVPVDLSEIRTVPKSTAAVSWSASELTAGESLGLPSPVAAETWPLTDAPLPAEPRFSWSDVREGLMAVWFAGTLLMLLTALVRVVRFHRLLRQTTSPASAELSHAADCVAWQMGLRRAPRILVTSAGLSPFVWWAGRQVLVIVPDQLLTSLTESRRDLLLAHEFAHVRRRDYLVRWLECGARALFWWNPMVWWAQKQLRISEEACCDDLVIRQMSVTSFEYASTLVDALETLVRPAIRPPAIVSAINSGGVLERRIQMILNGGTRPFSRSLYGLVCLVAFVVIPMGVVQAQDFEAVKRRLNKAVKHDEITFEQAAIMMDALLETHNEEYDHDDHDHDDHHAEHHDHDAHHDHHGEAHEHDAHAEIRAREEKLRHLERELRGAVERGQVTEEQAREKMMAIHRELEKEVREIHQAEQKRAMTHEMEAIEKKLWAAVKSGRMSEEDAKAKMAALKKELWQRMKDHAHDHEAHEREMHEREMHEHKEHAARQQEQRKRRYMELQGQIKAQVDAGKVPAELAEKKLIELRMKMWPKEAHDEEAHEHGAHEEGAHEHEAHEHEHDADERRADLERRRVEEREQEVRRQVEERQAKMMELLKRTREVEMKRAQQARAEAEQAREQAEQARAKAMERAERDRRSNARAQIDWKRIESRVKEAVEQGKISEEEAKERMAELKRRLGAYRKQAEDDDGEDEEEDEEDGDDEEDAVVETAEDDEDE